MTIGGHHPVADDVRAVGKVRLNLDSRKMFAADGSPHAHTKALYDAYVAPDREPQPA